MTCNRAVFKIQHGIWGPPPPSRPPKLALKFTFEVDGLLCVNDEEKSGAVLGYFLCISQLSSQKAKRPFFPPVYSMPSQTRLLSNPCLPAQETYALISLVN